MWCFGGAFEVPVKKKCAVIGYWEKWLVFYLDETWVNEDHMVKYVWQDSRAL
jgi:hypothetical protein